MSVLRLEQTYLTLLNSVNIFYLVTCNSIRSMRWTNRLVRNSFRWQRWRQKTCHIFSAVYLGPEQSIPFELNTDPRDLRTFIWSHNRAMPGLRKFTKTFTVRGAFLASSYSFGWNQVSDWLLCESSGCKTGKCQHQFAAEAGQGRKLKITQREKKLK